ncbi:hypothetical protein B9479_000931 [Cryptococcus floricola]|uniref:G-patch domain-containing protein n=1 Tax=Cryptococcus floricola TaxID=2591691 RepID=A0A5D3B3P6_9TREE|nr:hypothetical protein B9479_000931 [Cryptococcus floricola]
MAVKTARFDPARHLEQQGWAGKGTALQQGHISRPLAVVQKKTLSGIGKDRDEAVPFWDHIFAATAASLNIGSGSGSSSPAPPSSSWTTLTPAGSSSPAPRIPPKLSISAQTRMAREMARRQLYSRFFRGKVYMGDEEEEVEVKPSEKKGKRKASEIDSVVENGVKDSGLSVQAEKKKEKREKKEKSEKREKKDKSKGKQKEDETNEERRARRAEKKENREKKEAKLGEDGQPKTKKEKKTKREESSGTRIEQEKSSKKKRKEREDGEEKSKKKSKQ